MNKVMIAILLSAATLVSFQAHAGGPAIVGAVEGAVVGAHFGGAHGAVAGAIVGAAIGSAAEPQYERGYREPVYYERESVRRAPANVYYAPQPSYQPYYEPYYEPQRVVYVQPRVYDPYPVYYPAPVYVTRYSAPSRGYYNHRHGHSGRRGGYY